MDANGTVHTVEGRNVNGGKVCYEVASTLDSGESLKLATFDANLAQKAFPLQGQRASFRYNVVSKGQYTNYYLEEIAPEGALVGGAAPSAGSPAGSIPITNSGTRGGSGKTGGGGSWQQKDPEIQKSIVKQSSFATAFKFIASLYEGLGPDFLERAKTEAMDLANTIYKLAEPKASAGTSTAPAPVAAVVPAPAAVPATPEAVAAAVPGVQVGAPAPQDASPSDAVWD